MTNLCSTIPADIVFVNLSSYKLTRGYKGVQGAANKHTRMRAHMFGYLFHRYSFPAELVDKKMYEIKKFKFQSECSANQ